MVLVKTMQEVLELCRKRGNLQLNLTFKHIHHYDYDYDYCTKHMLNSRNNFAQHNFRV